VTEQEIANYVGMTEQEFLEWTQCFASSYIYFDDDVPCCIYTDGDCGLALIRGYCEIFDEDGFQISFPSDNAYCDINVKDMVNIMEELKTRTKNYLAEMENEDE
jgi:hypothetical protein